jgi:D-beta-D-heptose 7-phosphate kinase/D-beta-D-heptose 1-phosphate adenosyltransferase
MRIAIAGDVLLDRDVGGARRPGSAAPLPVLDGRSRRERPGGAGLAALVAARLGATVTLVTALGRDAASHRVRALLQDAGVEVLAVPSDGETAVKERIVVDDQPVARVDRGRAGRIHDDPAQRPTVANVFARADAVLVSDYGRGVTSHRSVRDALTAGGVTRPVVWDPHPRGAHPVAGTWLLTPNEHELGSADPAGDRRLTAWSALATRAAELCASARARAVAVTLAERGALLVTGDGPPLYCPSSPVDADPCGAGDAFAAGATIALAGGALHSEAVMAGVAAGTSFVRELSRETWSVAAAAPTPPEPSSPAPAPSSPPAAGGGHCPAIEATRAAGGTVVMTGGCFDVLHRGHVELLRHARSLGDCLVVCLNSDESVRRLKGPHRPVTAVEDRARVLQELASVDDVVVFDEDTPVPLLRRFTPDVFVKGGDYGGMALPEVPVLGEWGGQVVIVPYVNGYSTTRLLEEARHGR